MRAAFSKKYGPPENVTVTDVADPTPKADEILIKVHASSVNRTDDGFLRAKPFVTRFFSGLINPRHPILGCEFAGEVVETGSNVILFGVGDRVFGFDDVKWGGHGQLKTINESKSVAIIPRDISYEQAATSTEGTHYALSYIDTIKKLGASRVFVHGATGSIGSAAAQLLKQAGFYVVASSNTKNMGLVKSLGADDVVDWQQQDISQYGELFDVVFDAVGKSTFKICKPLLSTGGVYIATELGPYAQNPFLGLVSPLYRLFGAKRVLFPLPKNNKQLIEFIASRLEDGTYRPVIDKSYRLDQITEAYKYVETGQKTGNVVIRVS